MPPRRLPASAHPRPSRRGAVIIMVLVTVLVAAWLLSRFIERTTTELFVEARAAQAARLRTEANSALEVTLAVLADFRALDGGLRAPAQGWGDPLAYAGYVPRTGLAVDVAFEDESGKRSLPRLDAAALENLGELLGLRPADAARAADGLLTWTRRDHVPTGIDNDPRDYERTDPPHHPPQRPLRSFNELAAIEGVRDFLYDRAGRPNGLWRQFSRSVSLYDFPQANVNAPDPVALTLAGLDPGQVRQITAYLAGQGTRAPGAPPYFRSVGDLTALLGAQAPLAGLGTEVLCLRIRVTVREGSAAFHLTAVVAPPDHPDVAAPPGETDTAAPDPAKDLDYPFAILGVEENIESLTATPARP